MQKKVQKAPESARKVLLSTKIAVPEAGQAFGLRE